MIEFKSVAKQINNKKEMFDDPYWKDMLQLNFFTPYCLVENNKS